MFNKKKNLRKKSTVRDIQMPVPPVSATRIAVVLDDKVEEVLMAEGRLAALLLSQPKFVEIDLNIEKKPTIGWYYKNNEFVYIEEDKDNEIKDN
jgi:hypothetical protein